jgi:hypothetical protein
MFMQAAAKSAAARDDFLQPSRLGSNRSWFSLQQQQQQQQQQQPVGRSVGRDVCLFVYCMLLLLSCPPHCQLKLLLLLLAPASSGRSHRITNEGTNHLWRRPSSSTRSWGLPGTRTAATVGHAFPSIYSQLLTAAITAKANQSRTKSLVTLVPSTQPVAVAVLASRRKRKRERGREGGRAPRTWENQGQARIQTRTKEKEEEKKRRESYVRRKKLGRQSCRRIIKALFVLTWRLR